MSCRNEEEKKGKNSLHSSVKRWAEKAAISKIVTAYLTRLQGYSSVRYIEGIELSILRGCKRRRAIVVWDSIVVTGCVSGDFVECVDGQNQFWKKIEVQFFRS